MLEAVVLAARSSRRGDAVMAVWGSLNHAARSSPNSAIPFSFVLSRSLSWCSKGGTAGSTFASPRPILARISLRLGGCLPQWSSRSEQPRWATRRPRRPGCSGSKPAPRLTSHGKAGDARAQTSPSAEVSTVVVTVVVLPSSRHAVTSHARRRQATPRRTRRPAPPAAHDRGRRAW